MAIDRFDVGMIPAIVGRVTYHRRPRLRDLGRGRAPARALRPPGEDRRGSRPQAVRRPGAECAAPGEELRLLVARVPADLHALGGRPRPLRLDPEAGLHRPRRACCKARDAGPRQHLVTFVVEATDADVIGDEPIWRDGKVVGWVTSGGYAHCVQGARSRSAMSAPRRFDAAARYEIEIIGERRAAPHRRPSRCSIRPDRACAPDAEQAWRLAGSPGCGA